MLDNKYFCCAWWEHKLFLSWSSRKKQTENVNKLHCWQKTITLSVCNKKKAKQIEEFVFEQYKAELVFCFGWSNMFLEVSEHWGNNV